MRKNILITGFPRSGKSTILNKIVADFENRVGFVTNEVVENGKRVGFEIETHTGKKAMLANINLKTDFKVSKYFVNVESFDSILPEISTFKKGDVLFLDEIGQMELYSEKFKKAALKFLNSENLCIATLSKVYADVFIENIKKRDDVIIIEISQKDREAKQKFIEDIVGKVIKARRYVSEPKRFSIENNKAIMKTDHGNRHLICRKKDWICDCEFYRENKICSHVIAFEEFLKFHLNNAV